MIKIKCKDCGYKIPFLKKNSKDGNLYLNIDMYDLVCINCGHTLIELKNGFKDFQYRETRHNYNIRNGLKNELLGIP